MKQDISTVSFLEKRVSAIRKDAFGLNTRKKHVWLQKICCWILSALECHQQIQELSYEAVHLESRVVIRQLFIQRREILSLLNDEGTTVLMGSATFAEMMNMPLFKNMISIDGTYCYGGSRTLLGLRVITIPWMEGVLVLPKTKYLSFTEGETT